MKTHRTKVAHIGGLGAAILLVTLVLVSGAQAQKYEKYRVDGQKLTDQEKYVLAQTEKGEIADLLEKFVLPLIPEKDRQERARELGLAGYVEELDAGEKEVFLKSYPYRFRIRPRFLEILLTEGFPGCKIRPDAEAFLISYGDGLRIRAGFLETLLTEGFPGFKIHRHGVRIGNAIIKEPLDFYNAEVQQEVRLFRSILEGEAIFMGSSFKNILVLIGVQFLGEANFEGIKVGKNLFLRDAFFHGPVIFRMADIRGNFEAKGGQFLNKEQTANFNNMKVGQAAIFDDATFQGPVNFGHATTGSNFEADGAQFLNDKETASFNSLKVGGSAFFRKAEFQGPVNFIGANIGSQFIADGAQFLHNGKNSFESMKVGQYAFFRNVIFNGEIVFDYGNFLDLTIQGRKPTGGKTPEENQGIISLNLKGMTVQRNLEIKNMKIGELKANNCQVKGAATFHDLEINDMADLQNSNLQILKFINIKNLPTKESFRLDGLTYASLCVDEPEKYQKVIDLVDRSRFNTQNYLQLESFFKRSGHDQWANQAFIGMKGQELAQKAWWNPGRWLVKIFWGGLAGYGRAPLRVFWISLSLVILGALLFDPKYLAEDKRPASGKIYRSVLVRFLLGLDQFLPAVDMGLAKDWQAAANPFYIWAYFAFLQISGYVLVPIGLAAIYTQIK